MLTLTGQCSFSKTGKLKRPRKSIGKPDSRVQISFNKSSKIRLFCERSYIPRWNTYGGKRSDREDFRWNPATVQKHRFLSPFPTSFPPIPVLGNNNRIRLSFPERFPKADPTTSYGVKIRIVSRRIRTGFGKQVPSFLMDLGTDRILSYPEWFRNTDSILFRSPYTDRILWFTKSANDNQK
jgi:hypothetical protein